MLRVSHFTWPLILGIASIPAHAQTARRVTFPDDVAPILSKKCMQCHGQTPLMGSLDLRSRETALKGGQHGAAIVPGKAAASPLYRRLIGQEQPQMPLGVRLSEPEIEIIKDWIDSGAAWDAAVKLSPTLVTEAPAEKKFTEQQRRYWAFQKVTKPAVPTVKARDRARTPIDAFIVSKLESKNLKPNPPADKITLLRRATSI